MSRFEATIFWQRVAAEPFIDTKFSRSHVWRFDGGTEIAASSSPHIVPPPLSSPGNVDPEEAYIAALSSCHMLTFLFLAATHGFVVDTYCDLARGMMQKSEKGHFSITKVILTPNVTYSGQAPDQATEEMLHHEAHEKCFIANSVRTTIDIQLWSVSSDNVPSRGTHVII